MHKVTVFNLEGLDCADCAAKLEKKLAVNEGIDSVSLNFGAAKLTVAHQIPVEKIIQLVEDNGYRATRRDSKIQNQLAWWKDKKLALTGLSGIFLVMGLVAQVMANESNAAVGFYFLAMLSGGYYAAKAGIESLKALTLDMNFLMMIAALGAAAIGEWSEGAMVVFLFAVGNALQGLTMARTRKSIRALMDLTPQEAVVRRGVEEIKLPVEQLVVGDIVIVKPGERISVDGMVTSGCSAVNQAPITGESVPQEKVIGSEVYAGTINGNGPLEVKVTKLVEDTTLARIVHLVEEAQGQKAPSQQFVDVFSKYYTPIVVITALGMAFIPSLFFQQPFVPWFKKALILLVISCPCALVISTPVAIVAAIGSAARKGVLIKGGAYLEAAAGLQAVAFDKTGTLTKGMPEVTDVMALDGLSEREVVALAAAIESRAQHPLAQAVLRYANEHGIEAGQGFEHQTLPGKGAGARFGGELYYLGNTKLFEELGTNLKEHQSYIDQLQKQGKTLMVLGNKDRVKGLIAAADKVRDKGTHAIHELKKVGIENIIMLTGDNARTAEAVAQHLGIDEFRAELLPGDKLTVIKGLMAEHGRIAMVGDGINDAPALAAASIGIAMGGAGSDTALETADIALMSDDLTKLSYAVALSRKTLRIIKENIGFAILVKVLFIILTFMGLANLWMAVFADTGAALLVIANGLRLVKEN